MQERCGGRGPGFGGGDDGSRAEPKARAEHDLEEGARAVCEQSVLTFAKTFERLCSRNKGSCWVCAVVAKCTSGVLRSSTGGGQRMLMFYPESARGIVTERGDAVAQLGCACRATRVAVQKHEDDVTTIICLVYMYR